MPPPLLDTNAISDLMRGNALLHTHVGNHPDPIQTSVISIGEISYGLERLPFGQEANGPGSEGTAGFAVSIRRTHTESIANEYGRLKDSLERTGLNLEENDLWIAATALTLGSIL